MDMDDIELKLLVGLPIEVENVGNIYSPTVKEIIEFGYSKYNEILSCLLMDKSRLKLESLDEKVITTFTLLASLCFHEEDFRRKFLNGLNFIFKEEVFFGHNDEEIFFYFGDLGEMRYISEKNIEFIQALIRVSNQVKIQDEKEDEYNPADEQARKIIEEMLARRRNKPKPKPTVNLHSIISGLCTKSNGVNHLNVKDLSIYQLYDCFHRLEVVENYHYTLVGIYSGNVDGKQINYNKIHWTKIIEQ
jgi:hypothetical protein